MSIMALLASLANVPRALVAPAGLPGSEGDLDWAKAAAEELRRRFDAAERRVDDFRNRARILSSVIGAILALELTAAGKLMEAASTLPTIWLLSYRCWIFFSALLLFSLTLAYQLNLLRCLLKIGFGTRAMHGLPDAQRIAATKLTAATFYSQLLKAYADAAKHWEEAAGTIGRSVRDLARDVGASMALVFLVVVHLLAIGILKTIGLE